MSNLYKLTLVYEIDNKLFPQFPLEGTLETIMSILNERYNSQRWKINGFTVEKLK